MYSGALPPIPTSWEDAISLLLFLTVLFGPSLMFSCYSHSTRDESLVNLESGNSWGYLAVTLKVLTLKNHFQGPSAFCQSTHDFNLKCRVRRRDERSQKQGGSAGFWKNKQRGAWVPYGHWSTLLTCTWTTADFRSSFMMEVGNSIPERMLLYRRQSSVLFGVWFFTVR